MVLPPAPFKKWRTCPRCLPASKKSPQNPSISLALRPETIRHPDKRSKLENGATCGLSEIPEYVTTRFTWHRFAAIQIWIFVLFLIYTSIAELNAVLGGGRIGKIFFARRSAGIASKCQGVVTE